MAKRCDLTSHMDEPPEFYYGDKESRWSLCEVLMTCPQTIVTNELISSLNSHTTFVPPLINISSPSNKPGSGLISNL